MKQFHFYAKINPDLINSDEILLRFKNEYWFDHSWYFGMHHNVHFDYLYQCSNGFKNVR